MDCPEILKDILGFSVFLGTVLTLIAARWYQKRGQPPPVWLPVPLAILATIGGIVFDPVMGLLFGFLTCLFVGGWIYTEIRCKSADPEGR